MKPTVGRVVYYRDHEMSDQPCAAQIAYVHSDDVVNLSVLDRFGVQHSRTSISRGEGNYQWDWMPYQVQKAKAGDPNSESAEPRPEGSPA